MTKMLFYQAIQRISVILLTFMTLSENTNFDSDSENSIVQNNETGGEHLNNMDFTNEFGSEETPIQNFSNDRENEEDMLMVGNGLLVQIQGQMLDHSWDHGNY